MCIMFGWYPVNRGPQHCIFLSRRSHVFLTRKLSSHVHLWCGVVRTQAVLARHRIEMTGQYVIEHEHVSRVQLLTRHSRYFRLNDGPFRILHCIAFAAFAYCVLTHVPEESETEGLNLDGEVASTLEDSVELDGTVVIDEDADSIEPIPEMWEPETPQDYVRVIWAIITVFHVLTNLFCIWVVRVKLFCQFSTVKTVKEADHVFCVPHQNHGVPDIVPLTKRELRLPSQTEPEPHVEFDFRRIRFELDFPTKTFHAVRFPDSNAISSYLSAKGFTSDADVLAAIDIWGTNTVDVPVPHFMDMLKEQMLAPFFCFQVFCVLLWCMDAYWYYSLFTLFMLVMFECTVVFSRTRTLTDLRSIQIPKSQLQVHRSGKWQKLPGEVLLPGDVISIVPAEGTKNDDEAVAPADVLLISGTCVADEAVLTGESTPQWKEAITEKDGGPAEGARLLDVRQDKRNVIFGGTKLLNSAAGEKPIGGIQTPDGGALGVVLRTGFETAQGRLMRMILFSTERLTANNVETGLFICFLLIFALAAAGYVLYEGLQQPPEERSRFKLYLNCAMVITSVIPPELPMELTMAVNNSLIALRRQAIFCTEPFRIPFAGKVEVCCFDKTGTLTSDHMLLHGLTAVPDTNGTLKDSSDSKPSADPVGWSKEASLVMACCNTLMNIDGELIGDPLEKAAFLATGWQLSSGSGGSTGAFRGSFAGTPVSVKQIQKFHFSSELKRMAVVVRVATSRGSELDYVLAKGAPEILARHFGKYPAGYENAHRQQAARGGRVIAIAAKQIQSATLGDLKNMSREEAESGLQFLGCAVFNTPLKPGSVPALKMLASSSHQLVMITGDAPLTACFTAREVHIVDRPVLILQCDQPTTLNPDGTPVDPSDEHFSWRAPDDSHIVPFAPERSAVVQLALNYDLCVTGEGLQHCCVAGIDDVVIGCCQVFARVSPDQKEHIIKIHRAAGRTALMCGDGTNDVGALKAAHVGVALMEPPSESKIQAARLAQREHIKKKQEQLRRQMQGLPPSPRKTTDADGNLLPGSELLRKFEEQGKEVPESMKKWAEWLDQQSDGSSDGMPPLLKPGDASMASPFTVRAVDVMPTTDVIKQGRCTLVVTIQMFKILGLLSLSAAYSLSVLYLAGVKLGDIQATFQGFLSAGLFFFVANAKPRKTLSSARPHQSVFSPYVILSLLGQFAVQIGFLVYMFRRSYAATDPEERQAADAEFKPNLVNTVCFVVQNALQLITFAVNYIGEPFQTPLFENTAMISSLRISSLILIVVASGLVPQVTSYVQLVTIPTDIRTELFGGVFAVALITAGIERSLRDWFPAFMPPRKGYMSHLDLIPQKDKLV